MNRTLLLFVIHMDKKGAQEDFIKLRNINQSQMRDDKEVEALEKYDAVDVAIPSADTIIKVKENIIEIFKYLKKSYQQVSDTTFCIYDNFFLKASKIFFSSLETFTCVRPSIWAVVCWEYSFR